MGASAPLCPSFSLNNGSSLPRGVRCVCLTRMQASLYTVKGIIVLDNDGKRILAKVWFVLMMMTSIRFFVLSSVELIKA